MTDTPGGLLLLDKPSGITSFDCVHEVKRKLGAKRVGHCGTLDPLARGLLMVLVGPATRTQDSFLGLEKEYWFRGEFGFKTSTGDLEGKTIEERRRDPLASGVLQNTLAAFTGEIKQLPPMYSALKYKGRPYYDYARKGVAIPRTARAVLIHAFTLLSLQWPFWDARVACSRGTYIRTLVEDIAERLGTCGTLVELVRERVGPYHLHQALAWPELRRMNAEDLWSLLLPVAPQAALAHA